MIHTCDCGKGIQMPQSHGYGESVVGLSCPCGIYWSIAKDKGALWGRAVRWICKECGSSKQFCKNAPPMSKCYRGDQ